MMEKNYRWGIIGPGTIAQKFAAALPLAGNAVLEVVASREAARAKDFAARFHANRWYDSYEKLAEDPSVDAVYIATPHAFHAELALLCLRQGKAVLCEKPIALYQNQAAEMVAAARVHQCFLMEAMWTRFLPVMKKTLELIGEGRIGTVKYVRADFGFAAPFNPESRLYNPQLGGGSLLDVGIYPLFLCLLLLGEPDSIRACGQLAETGVDESCHAILHYARGCFGMISSGITCNTSATAEIAGTEGMIRIPTSWYKSDRLTLQRPGEEPQIFTLDPVVNGFEYEAREVMSCLEQGWIESPLMPHDFSLLLSKVMDRIREQTGVHYTGE
jgi:predicted dehydrogenase